MLYAKLCCSWVKEDALFGFVANLSLIILPYLDIIFRISFSSHCRPLGILRAVSFAQRTLVGMFWCTNFIGNPTQSITFVYYGVNNPSQTL